MQFHLILARSSDGTIGLESGTIPWKQSADMKRFKEVTTGHVIITGRKTWDTFNNRPLPNRTTIVLTRNPEEAFAAFNKTDNSKVICKYPLVIFTNNLESVHIDELNPEHTINEDKSQKPAFFIGGAEIYSKALHGYGKQVTKVYLTEIVVDFQHLNSVRFNDEFPETEWERTKGEGHPPDSNNQFYYRFDTYDRRQ